MVVSGSSTPRGAQYYVSTLLLVTLTIYTVIYSPSDNNGRLLFISFVIYLLTFYGFRSKWSSEEGLSSYSVFNDGTSLPGETTARSLIPGLPSVGGTSVGGTSVGGKSVGVKGPFVNLKEEEKELLGEEERVRRRNDRAKAATLRIRKGEGGGIKNTTMSVMVICTIGLLGGGGVEGWNGGASRSTSANSTPRGTSRRSYLSYLMTTATTTNAMVVLPKPSYSSTPTERSLIIESINQLETIPPLIKSESWDSIRSVLSKPPLRDCWKSNSPFLKSYASTLSDELSGLEASEDAVTHLRFLDMAAYNNVFNPISTEGKSGATKELVRSYEEDPGREWRESLEALKKLEELGGE